MRCPFRQHLATLPCPRTCRPRIRRHAPESRWPTWCAARSMVARRVQASRPPGDAGSSPARGPCSAARLDSHSQVRQLGEDGLNLRPPVEAIETNPAAARCCPIPPTLDHTVKPNGERWAGVHGEARGGQACRGRRRVRPAVVLGPVSCRQRRGHAAGSGLGVTAEERRSRPGGSPWVPGCDSNQDQGCRDQAWPRWWPTAMRRSRRAEKRERTKQQRKKTRPAKR